MKERPILFSGSMVRAILAGKKTQTRRLVQRRHATERFHKACLNIGVERALVEFSDQVRAPYGASGDRLWVRETWGFRGTTWASDEPDVVAVDLAYRADDAKRQVRRPVDDRSGTPRQICRCSDDGDELDRRIRHEEELLRYWRAWTPSIHMPRWASRITLEVTGVRIERLQAITEADAVAEGVTLPEVRRICPCETQVEEPGPHIETCPWRCPSIDPTSTPHVNEYACLWDTINAKRDAWASNPWVWVVEFRRQP